MPKYVPIGRSHHQAYRWLRYPNYRFSGKDVAAPIVGAEIAKAVLSMPIAFVTRGSSFQLAAMLSAVPGMNMFVSPDGRWLSGYIPAVIRAYPFRLLTPQGEGEPILCIDEESGLLSRDDETGEPFFDTDGAVSPQLGAVLNFLGECERSRAVTDLAVAALEQANLIVPWQIKIHTEQGEQSVEGLYKIDEAALNALPTESFEKLRATGALPIAYGQLFSMNQLSVFKTLADLQAKMAPKPAAALPDTLDKLFDMGNTDVLRFD
jgi:hypothetical protein